ncbi:MAG: ROK family protein [Alphaproteobacteria bacterium]
MNAEPSGGPRIGIDVGGTKIAGVLFRGDGTVLAEDRVDTPRSFDGVVAALATMVEAFAPAAGGEPPGRVGICMPGQIARDGAVLACVNLPWLVGMPVAGALAQRVGKPVVLANDANCFALSEAIDGAGRGAAMVFGLTLGTGVGGGLVADGRIVVGANALAGEWGHMRFPFEPAVDPAPSTCGCGRQGCNETVLRARALVDDYRRLGGAAETAEQVAARIGSDPRAHDALARYCDRLARALVDVVHLLDPDVLVVGGGLSKVSALFAMMPALLARYAVGDIGRTRLVPACFGAESGVRGAARL